MPVTVLICTTGDRPRPWIDAAFASVDGHKTALVVDPVGPVGRSRAAGMAGVGTPYTAILDDDDELMAGAVADCVAALDARPDACFAYTRHERFGLPVAPPYPSPERPGTRRHAFETAAHLVVYRTSAARPHLTAIADHRFCPERILRGRMLQSAPAVFVDRLGYRWRQHEAQTSRRAAEDDRRREFGELRRLWAALCAAETNPSEN